VIQDFKILDDKISFFVGDNYGSNDKMIYCIKRMVKGLLELKHIRVRCLGYVINLVVYMFLYKNDKEAIEITYRFKNRDTL